MTLSSVFFQRTPQRSCCGEVQSTFPIATRCKAPFQSQGCAEIQFGKCQLTLTRIPRQFSRARIESFFIREVFCRALPGIDHMIVIGSEYSVDVTAETFCLTVRNGYSSVCSLCLLFIAGRLTSTMPVMKMTPATQRMVPASVPRPVLSL